MAPPSTTRRLLHSRRVPRPRRPLFPSIHHRRHRHPRCPLHLSLSPPHNTPPPPSIHLTLAPPAPQPSPSSITQDPFWWLHAPHAKPPTAWLHALWAEVCKEPSFIEAGKNKLEDGSDQVFHGATLEARMLWQLWMDGAWKT